MFLLSSHPWFSIFSSVLKALEQYAFKLSSADATLAASSPIHEVLRTLSKTKLPPPGAPKVGTRPSKARVPCRSSGSLSWPAIAGKVIPAPHVAGGPGLPPLTVPQDRGTGPQNADVYFAPLMWRVPVASLLNLLAVRAVAPLALRCSPSGPCPSPSPPSLCIGTPLYSKYL